MKRTALALTLISALLLSAVAEMSFMKVAKANPGPATQIAPIVSVPEMQVNATISRVNGTLWAKVDAAYQMDTVYAFGDTYQAENYGFGLLVNPSPFITVTVAYDRLDAQFPVPLNTTNVSVKMDGQELDWAPTNRTYHLFDADLPELHWKISPVPSDFSITAHYEHPIPIITQTHADLGSYALLFPLGSRYGLQEIIDYAYNEYPWFGNSTAAQISIRTEPILTSIRAYSMDGFGTLKPLDYTVSKENAAGKIDLVVSGEIPDSDLQNTTRPFGVVVVFDEATDTSEPFPTTWLIAAAAVAAVGAALLVYLKKRGRRGS
jgi:hypothetical protein